MQALQLQCHPNCKLQCDQTSPVTIIINLMRGTGYLSPERILDQNYQQTQPLLHMVTTLFNHSPFIQLPFLYNSPSKIIEISPNKSHINRRVNLYFHRRFSLGWTVQVKLFIGPPKTKEWLSLSTQARATHTHACSLKILPSQSLSDQCMWLPNQRSVFPCLTNQFHGSNNKMWIVDTLEKPVQPQIS